MRGGARLAGALLAAAFVASACGASDPAADVSAQPVAESSSTAPTTVIPTTTTSTSTTTSTTTPATTSTTSTTTSTTTTSTTMTSTTTTSTTTTTVVPSTTACRSVAVIADSTFVRMEQLLLDELRAIGATDVILEVDGGRSVVERLYAEQENGAEVAARIAATGFSGCWVLALGTNDAANIAAGSGSDVGDRVARMLTATGSGPVLWIDASTITTDSFWARPNILIWNDSLLAETAGSDRVRIALWDRLAVDQPWWFDDGIHNNDAGLVARAAFVADELVAQFPG